MNRFVSVALALSCPVVLACSSNESTNIPAFAASSAAPAAPGAPAAGTELTAAAPAASAAAGEPINPRLLRRFKALQPVAEGAPAQVALGRQLFFDKRLSAGGDLSCNSCHLLDQYGVDHQPTSPGMGGKRGQRNSPTVYHASGHFTNFWDGRAPNVEEQAKGPITNPIEMAMPSPERVVAVLSSIPGYVDAFRVAFPGDPKPLTYDNVAKAIATFERGLATPSRWDSYLNGDTHALSAQETKGLKLFCDLGCMTCHTGEFLGGSSFQKVGVIAAWPNQADQGRYNVTKVDADRMTFKVPSLRNVAKTAPYFHDGSVAELSDAVVMMARHQLGEELSKPDVDAIVAWLGSLTGEIPAAYIQEPALPPDGPTTKQLALK